MKKNERKKEEKKKQRRRNDLALNVQIMWLKFERERQEKKKSMLESCFGEV